jgi:hypothetical protein
LSNFRLANGRLSFGAAGWAEAQIAQFRAQLAGIGWDVNASNGVLTVSRGRST